MTDLLQALDRQRARWTQGRMKLLLVDTDSPDFGSRGIAGRVKSRSVRILLLPEDPEAWRIDFDDVFWKWYGGDHPDPISNQSAGWGMHLQPNARAAIRSAYIDPNQTLLNYVALHHSGALEVELGESGGRDGQLNTPAGVVPRTPQPTDTPTPAPTATLEPCWLNDQDLTTKPRKKRRPVALWAENPCSV